MSLRCTHCGREVRSTTHTRDGWAVDGYSMHTGAVEPATYRRDENSPPIDYLRLVRPEVIVTCAACYARPEIRRQRLFPAEEEA